MKNEKKMNALAKHLGCEAKDFDMVGECRICTNPGRPMCGDDWLVCTDEEATKLARERIHEELWAFNPSFVSSHCPACDDMTAVQVADFEECLKAMAEKMCESANGVVLALIGGEAKFNDFADAAIAADGRGHFLSSYNGDEVELDDGLYAYRD